MPSPSEAPVTRLLAEVREGNGNAEALLFDEVYAELRQRAQGQRKRWRGDPSLRTTALAHEAYLELVKQSDRSWENRA